MNTALIIKDINHRLYSLEIKTKANKITFPFIGVAKNKDVAFLDKGIEVIFLINSPTKISTWDKDLGSKLVQGQSAKELINKLSFLLDK